MPFFQELTASAEEKMRDALEANPFTEHSVWQRVLGSKMGTVTSEIHATAWVSGALNWLLKPSVQ